MQDKDAIPFQHWSLKVGRIDAATRAVPPYFGKIVTAIDDLHQCIMNLILTPVGSVPTEPEMGCDIASFIDRPSEIAVPQITRAVWDALTIWEPRVVVQDVKIEQVAFAHFACDIYWRPVESVLDDLLVTQVSLGSAAANDHRVA